MKTIRDFISQYPTPEGECYELERTSPRYKGIILTDRNNVEKLTLIHRFAILVGRFLSEFIKCTNIRETKK